jgi:hypothetical protein
MSLFSEYPNEAEFRERFVKPLLNRLGFFAVTHEHGSQEFGKDFVFSELHRLGGLRHYAAQVKHEEKISQGRHVDDLLSQIRQAFATPFRRADSPRECHVAAVYVFNSGEITANAKKQLLDELKIERYGDNVHFLDGERLSSLNQWSTYQNDREVRTRLSALKTQLGVNIGLWEVLSQWKYEERVAPDGRGIIWAGIESYLSQPIEGAKLQLQDVYNLWSMARAIDAIRLRLFNGTVRLEFRESEARHMQELINEVVPAARSLITQIDDTLAEFHAL